MTTRTLALITAAVLGVLLVCSGLTGITLPGRAGCTAPAGMSAPTSAPAPGVGGTGPVGRWDTEQAGNAATIIDVGHRRQVPPRGWIIAVATAMQESQLRNLPGGPDDSIGLFQQRPSQGWGTPAQLRDPQHQASRFYQRLSSVGGWQTMPLTAAAQAVQISAYPDAYAKWEPDATRLVTAITPGSTDPDAVQACTRACPAVTEATGCGTAGDVFGRARSWLTAWPGGGAVPYLSSGTPAHWFGGYRRDCSGYVSMALGLPGPGLNTSGLAARSTAITKADLRPGDLLINTAPNLRGHVVLFERWTDASMTRYHGYEQSGGSGTHHRVIPYPYFGDYPMTPYRFGTTE